MPAALSSAPPLRRVEVYCYTIPTESLESDGTLEWDSTTLVVVEVGADESTGVGYTYSDCAAGRIICELLADVILGSDPMDIPAMLARMRHRVRNLGAVGICAHAISAVDCALWDLKAKMLQQPLAKLIGQVRPSLPIYGSGGFTSYSDRQLREQLSGWAEQGLTRMKIKVGRCPKSDLARVRSAREAIGPENELFVDANSAYDRSQALYYMERFAADFNVTWLEQPLDPHDYSGMRLLRDRAPAGLEIADGEYGYILPDFRAMIMESGVHVLMADATRCHGISGLLEVDHLCRAHSIPLSTHCAPLLHLQVGTCLPSLRHAEYFHDHVEIESRYFEGLPEPSGGALSPDLKSSGLGLAFKHSDAQRFRQQLS